MGWITRAVPLDQLEQEVMNEARAIALMPRDSIVIGKAHRHMFYDKMGWTTEFTNTFIAHALFSNMHFEPDEFSLLRERSKVESMRDVIRARDERYKEYIEYFSHALQLKQDPFLRIILSWEFNTCGVA